MTARKNITIHRNADEHHCARVVVRRSLVRQALDAAAAAGSPVVFSAFDGCPCLEAAHQRGLFVPAASIAKAVRDGLLVGYDGKPAHWSCANYSRWPRKNITIHRNADEHHCALCGKLVSSSPEMIRVHGGGSVIVHAEDPAIDLGGESADMGLWPIGSECARKVPVDLRIKN